MQILFIVCSALCALFGIYFAYTSFAGLLKEKPHAIPHMQPSYRLAAVIAARNEENVIAELIRSLQNQNYPRALFDIYVIPNNCTDRTEEAARNAGALILPCTIPVHTKGDALRCAFTQLMRAEKSYDAYCIFDADNLAEEMFFQAVNDMLCAGYHAAQGVRDSKNPYDNWISGSMSAFYWFMNRFYNESRARLGMSAVLNGTGFMVSDHLLREIGFETFTLTEDLEFSAQCALHKIKIGWMPEGRIYDEQPIFFRDSIAQRRRWSAGAMQCFKRYTKQLFQAHTLHAFDMGMLFCGMLITLFGLLSGLSAVVLTLHKLWIDPSIFPALLYVLCIGSFVGWGLLCAGCVLLFSLEGRLTKHTLPAVLLFPLFLLTWMPINLLCFFSRPPKWTEIRHTGNRTFTG